MRALAAAALLIVACAPPRPPAVTAADATRANVSLAELEQGRGLLIRKCGGCHVTPMPHQYSPTEWPSKIGEMAERAHLDPAQIASLERYLITMTCLLYTSPSPRDS